MLRWGVTPNVIRNHQRFKEVNAWCTNDRRIVKPLKPSSDLSIRGKCWCSKTANYERWPVGGKQDGRVSGCNSGSRANLECPSRQHIMQSQMGSINVTYRRLFSVNWRLSLHMGLFIFIM